MLELMCEEGKGGWKREGKKNQSVINKLETRINQTSVV